MGGPKALLRDEDGTPWVVRSVRVLAAGGCDPVLVVVGAAADEVRALLPPQVRAVTATDWRQGMGASLRAGLATLAGQTPGESADAGTPAAGLPASPVPGPDAGVVGLVDTPGVTSAVVARLVAVVARVDAGPDVLARACYRGIPGHPVLLGRRHWAGAASAAHGDAGARGYLAARSDVRLVESGDVGHGEDRDIP
jgi:CTP:molybdopterin cytidylyltransferase MocA